MSHFRNLFLAVFAASFLQAAPITVSPIYVSIGPDGNTSPSYAAYTANAIVGVTTNAADVGGSIQTTPSAFNLAGNGPTVAVSGPDITNTPFPSWLGVADPAGALSGQLGNMIYWNVVITGTNISLSQINVTQASTDPGDSFGNSSNPGGLFTHTYSTYEPDVVGITSGGIEITSGASTQPVNTIIITGFAAAQSGYGFNFSGTDAQKLQQTDSALAGILGNYTINTCFYYGAASNTNPNTCDAVDVTNITAPEPSAFTYAALSLLLLPRLLSARGLFSRSAAR